ncbi:MAG: nucleotidyl transferase AbiEii/AbiGii toxin family protein [Chloroflexi bacterium]|nr:nucleotidyl transferase AbiEii/AbiGii toxin family protein [Chloroflexota bacterium]
MTSLPPLPNRELLADLCLEVAATEGVQPFAIDKDFYLTRLIWALAQELGDRLLLKGGTLLSKVDLGFRRMSEDVDLVIPWAGSRRHRGINASETNRFRDALRRLARIAGLRLENHNGEVSERGARVIWTLLYESSFSPQAVDVEVALRPVLRIPRRAGLSQLLSDPLIGDYAEAYCWALDADEARAEKVRAAFTREAIRDFYDLCQLRQAGADFTSERFRLLVDQKLAELAAPPLSEQAASFGLTPERRRRLDAERRRGLQAVVRVADDVFDLEAMLADFDALWDKR